MIGYPYSYGDRLAPKKARNNRKQAVFYSVLIPTILYHNLEFGEPIQFSSSRGNAQISRLLKQKSSSMSDLNQEGSAQLKQVLKGTQTALKIPSEGDSNRPSKFGPGAKAKGDDKRDFARQQTGKKPTSGKSSGSIFSEAFSPNIIHRSRPTPLSGKFNIPKAPSSRYTATTINDRGVKNQPKSATSLKVERPT